MITLTATLNLEDLNSLAAVLTDHANELLEAVGATRSAYEAAAQVAGADALPGRATARAEAAFAEYEEATDALDRWNALRAELGLR